MAIPTFIQNSRINRVIFQIRDDHLLVSARSLVGPFTDYRFDLRSLDPNYQPRITRNYALLIVPLVGALLCAAVLWSLWQQTLLPREAVMPLYQYAAVGFAVSLGTAIRGSRRIEYFQFNNLWNRPAFSIIRERAQAADCADFIAALVAHIEVAQSDLPPEERIKLLRRLPDTSNVGSDLQPGQNKWMASILLGSLAVVFPLLFGSDSLDPLLFPVMFLLCVSGAALCVFSFLAKEPRRWWSAIGMALSLLPPFF